MTYRETFRKFQVEYWTGVIAACSGNMIKASEVSGFLRQSVYVVVKNLKINPHTPSATTTFNAIAYREAARQFRIDYWIIMIAVCGNNMNATARATGMHRSAMYKQIKLLGVALPRVCTGRRYPHPGKWDRPIPTYAD